MFACPKCEGNTYVEATSRKDEPEITRIRVCWECGYRFKTKEVEIDVQRRKPDGSR